MFTPIAANTIAKLSSPWSWKSKRRGKNHESDEVERGMSTKKDIALEANGISNLVKTVAT